MSKITIALNYLAEFNENNDIWYYQQYIRLLAELGGVKLNTSS
jgi:hypothetical protein